MKICFFTSVGDDPSLLYYINQNHGKYDIICNYYGSKTHTFNEIKNLSVHAENYHDCKFPALKKIYFNYINLKNYDYVFVYDDDAIVVKGSLDNLIDIAVRYNLGIISSAHDPKGKITWQIHLPKAGNHILRYVNFIEINFPVFSRTGLSKFMNEYDDGLCDYGIDHWYTKVLQPEINRNMGIVDSVIIHNPKNSIKLNKNVHPKIRLQQMNNYNKKYDIKITKPKNLDFIHE